MDSEKAIPWEASLFTRLATAIRTLACAPILRSFDGQVSWFDRLAMLSRSAPRTKRVELILVDSLPLGVTRRLLVSGVLKVKRSFCFLLGTWIAASLVLQAAFAPTLVFAQDSQLPIGASRIEITPSEPVVLAGYGHRNAAFEGVDQPLYARAISLGDTNPVIAITVDNCGVPQAIADRVKGDLQAAGLTLAERIVILSTHTHNAPSLPGYAPVLWAERTTPEQDEATNRYTDFLVHQLRVVATEAWQKREAAELAWGLGEVDFGGNRRIMIDGVWSGFGLQSDAPVDHSLPMLVATRTSTGEPLAIWTTYACHCTTLGGVNRVAGDWAGCAALEIESRHSECVALVSIGCGADVGPQPAGSAAITQQHGVAVADEVDRLLEASLTGIVVLPSVSSRRLQLPFERVPGREYWESEVARGGFEATRARRMLARLDRGETLPQTLDYDITTWKFGNALAMVFLPGEVTVDYAVELKTRLDWSRLWIHGWANDVPCYIPSRRVLLEGGYEADFSMVYYDHPSRFALEVEETIEEEVSQLLGDGWLSKPEQPVPDWFKYRLSSAAIKRRLEQVLPGLLELDSTQEFLARLPEPQLITPGFEAWKSGPQRSAWYDFLGLTRDRGFLRQDSRESSLSWSTAPMIVSEGEAWVVFTGGMGWSSQPATEGFELSVFRGDERVSSLMFDIDPDTTRRSSDDQRLTLSYLATWRSDEDSAGIYLLRVQSEELRTGESLSLEVRSLGSGSQRWFAVDDSGDILEVVKLLR